MKTLLRGAPSGDGLDILTWHTPLREVRTATLTGCSLADTAAILGFGGRAEMVHRDELAVGPGIRALARPLMQPTVVLMSPLRVSL